MPVHDFLAPFAQVEITNKASAEWVFDVGRWPTTNAAGDRAVMGGPFVTSVSVTMDQSGVHDGLTIGIEAPYLEGINLLEQGVFDFNNLVRARIGYLATGEAQVTQDFAGLLTKGGDGLALSSDRLSGSITATFQNARQTEYVKSGEGLFGETAQTILDSAAAAAGYTAVARGGADNLIKALSDKVKAAGQDIESIYYGIEGSVSRMAVVRQILSMANCDWHIGGASFTGFKERPALFYYPKDYAAQLKPQYLLVMRGLFDPTASPAQYPIMDLSFSGGIAMWDSYGRRWNAGAAPAATAGVRAVVIEKDTGTVLDPLWTWPADLDRPFDPKGSAVAAEAQDDKRGEIQADAKVPKGGKQVPANRSVTAPGGAAKVRAEQGTKAQAMGAADRAAITLTVTTLGIPEIEPGRPVAVVGCSSMIDSTYNIRKATHNYAPGNWTTVLELVKWGSIMNSNQAQTVSAGAPMKDA